MRASQKNHTCDFLFQTFKFQRDQQFFKNVQT